MKKVADVLTWLLVSVSRVIVACTLMFSGIVKVIDPLGFQYKLTDYAQAFGLDVLTRYPIVLLFLGIAIATFEFLMGVSVLFGISRKGTSRVVALFLTGMTSLTLYLALKNPVADCGCFGDALVLTNWETFYKNLVLLFCSMVLVVFPKHVTRLISVHTHWMVSIYSFLFAIGIASYALVRLPIIDFRPYYIGANLAEEPQFKTVFTLRKDGETKEFDEADYPYDDTTWVYVDSRTEQTGESHDFEMVDTQTGEDISQQVVTDSGYTFLLIVPDMRTVDSSMMDALNALYDYCQTRGYHMYALSDLEATGAADSIVEHWRDVTGAEYPFYQTDMLTLKTMVRSNPGLMLLKDGYIANKWSNTNMPTEEDLTAPLDSLPLAHTEAIKSLEAVIKPGVRAVEELQEHSLPFTEKTISLQGWDNMTKGVRLILFYIVPVLVLVFADRMMFALKALLQGIISLFRRRKKPEESGTT